jgi:hypothetical protein
VKDILQEQIIAEKQTNEQRLGTENVKQNVIIIVIIQLN